MTIETKEIRHEAEYIGESKKVYRKFRDGY